MKIFAFIMALTVLALSVLPCTDASEVFDNTTKSAISKSDNQHSPNESDDCSPFCSCSCCAASATYHVQAVNYLHKPLNQEKQYAGFKPSFYSEISFSIWQPPKIA